MYVLTLGCTQPIDTPRVDRLQDDTGTLSISSEPINFRTFPDPRLPVGSHFKFLVSSCMTPNFPYLPLQGRRIKGFDLLADYLWPASSGISPTSTIPAVNNATELAMSSKTANTEATMPTAAPTVPPVPLDTTPATEFMLFLGDFIYADVPLYFGDNQDMYKLFYRRNYHSSSFRKVYERLRKLSNYSFTVLSSSCHHLGLTAFVHTYDDHDVSTSTPHTDNAAYSCFLSRSKTTT